MQNRIHFRNIINNINKYNKFNSQTIGEKVYSQEGNSPDYKLKF